MNWRKLSDEKPKDEQDCLVSMKHGVHQGVWNEKEETFHTYLFNDVEFYGRYWVPIEEAKVPGSGA